MEKSHDTPDDAWTCFSFRLTSHVSSHYCFFIVEASIFTRLGSLDYLPVLLHEPYGVRQHVVISHGLGCHSCKEHAYESGLKP